MTSSKNNFRVTTGNMTGYFCPERYGPCGKSVCILYQGNWMTPCEFQTKAKNGSSADSHLWKRTIKLPDSNNKSLLTYFRSGNIKQCDKGCQCANCKLAIHHVKAKGCLLGPLNVAVESDVKPSKDNDSDSGISNISSTLNAAEAPLTSVELTSTPDGLPDYTFMVREAIMSVSSGSSSQGCSRLCVMLYVLSKYQPKDDIQAINQKIKSALKLLHRVGVVGKVGDSDDDSDAEELCLVKPLATKQVFKKEEDDPEVEFKPKILKKKLGRPPGKLNVNQVALKKVKKAMNVAKENRSKSKVCVTKNGLKRVYKMKKLSPSLEAICGKKQMARNDVVSKVWQYIRKKNLQDPNQKTRIYCDEKLKALTKKSKVNQTEILSVISSNMKE